MNIGAASKGSGISAKMIRYYENTGLIDPIARSSNGYRDYSEQDVHMLRFIGKARQVGFQMNDVTELLALWKDQSRASRDVRELANTRIDELKRRIADLNEMVKTLENLSATCHGDDRPQCPILDSLAGAT